MSLDFESSIVDLEKKIQDLVENNEKPSVSFDKKIGSLQTELEKVKTSVYSKLTPWQRVQIARNKDRPLLEDYISLVFSDFIELHGDRRFGDDRGLIGGFATIGKQKVMLIGFDKGRTIEDKIRTNFGMAHPEGYRKSLRLMKLAEKYGIPIVCLIDTPAAYPGAAAEERGQAEAIARSITEMSSIEVPIVVVITGEGGSGGALGVAVGDRIVMFSNSIYSVIPPEGCAAILWRDAEKAPEAAEALRITAESLIEMGIIDEIIPEPAGGAHRDHKATAAALKECLIRNLQSLKRLSQRKLMARRYDKFAQMGRPR